MDSSSRARAVVFIAPLLVAFIGASRVAGEIRTVDFLQVFAAGMITGISLAGIIRMLKAKGTSKP